MTRRLFVTAWLTMLPAAAAGQTVTGVAEVTAAQGTSTSDHQTNTNNAIWQLYSIGYEAPLIDPRLMKYNTAVTFRSSSLALGGDQQAQQGKQGGLGYALGASLFPTRPFPFFIQVSRDIVNESAGYPSTGTSRAGLVLPPDTPIPDFQTTTRTLTTGWQLNATSLPRVELNYRRGNSEVAGGPYDATRTDSDLQAGVFEDGQRTRQTLRFERTALSNAPAQAFNQRASDLNYELTSLVGRRSRFVVRTGSRTMFSLFDLQPSAVDVGKGNYTLPSQGDVHTSYVTTGLTWEPATRLSVDITGGFDRQDSGSTTLNALLANTSARLEIFRGFSINGSGTYGERGQVVNDATVTVTTTSALAGSTFRTGPHWFEMTLNGARGIGFNMTPEGERGEVRTWSGQATLSSSWRWVSLSTGYDRAESADAILLYGNYAIERTHWSAQHGSSRVSISAELENAIVSRGKGDTLTHTHQNTFTGTVSLNTRKGMLLAVNAGGFHTDTSPNIDRTLFYGGSFDMRLRRALHLSAWARRERVLASQTALDQQNLYLFGSVEYGLRLFRVALEYQHNEQALLEHGLDNPFHFRGHQARVRLTRTFGFRR
jgi:hypothetical protein